MAKINPKANRLRLSGGGSVQMNSIVAAASTAHDLDVGHKTVLEAARKRALAKKLASQTRGI